MTRLVSGRGQQWLDLLRWLALVAAGLAVTAFAVHIGARLGTAGAPFLGRYRFHLSPATLFAPALALSLLTLQAGGWFDRTRWALVATGGYLAALAWSLSLVLVDGESGLVRPLHDPANYLAQVDAVRDTPLHYLRHADDAPPPGPAAIRGHPPGPVLLLWAAHRAGVHSDLDLALLIMAIGALTVPLALSAVRGVCGDPQSRRYAAVLILAPYALWTITTDVVTAVLGAAMIAAGVRASDERRTGWLAGGWALAAGAMLGLAAMMSYSAPWLGLSVVCLYFARRRPFLNLGTALGALLPVLVADALGFDWLRGLALARADYTARVEPSRPVLWWSVISLVTLLLACGPALVASLRKLRNTPGWPFLVGAGCAVAFSILAGLARGGVEHSWLAFFPWLTVAAVAPQRQGGPAPPAPWVLVAAGAVATIIIEAVLATTQ